MKNVFKIQNLKCEGCENTIISNLLSIDGITKIALNIPTSEITLEYDAIGTLNDASKKLSKIGYPLVGDKNNLLKKATSYVSCAIGKFST